MVTKSALLISFALVFAAPLSADVSRVTSGTVQTTGITGAGVIVLETEDGFRFDGRTLTGYTPLAWCRPCAPGTLIDLRAGWTGGDLRGTALWQGTSYSVGGASDLAAGAIAFTGQVLFTPPAAGAVAATLTAPFQFGGSFGLFYPNGPREPGYRVTLIGSGWTTLRLTRFGDSWYAMEALYEFDAPPAPPPPAPMATTARADFDGDGKADILWRHIGTGDVAVWLMDGSRLAASAFLPAVRDSAWTIAGTGDFDGDGRSDIVWRHRTTGDNAIWRMNGLTLADSALITPVRDIRWMIMATRDHDGDGRSDILWRNTHTGEIAVWLMNGFTIKGSAFLPTVADQSWVVQQ